jgi:hypothetical protein
MIPGGDGFWKFLNGMVEGGICVSCKEGSGDPGCKVRICAREKNIEMCAFCSDYPCGHFDKFFENLPILRRDNELLRKEGKKAWAKLQDERNVKGFTYSDEKKKC